MFSLVIVLAIVANCAQGALSVAVKCTNSKQVEAFCRTLEDCPHLKEPFLTGQLNFKDICSFGGQPTVCCDTAFISRIGSLPENNKRPSEKYCDHLKDSLPESLGKVIFGGEQTEIGEFPHMAGLYYRDSNNEEVRCGGSLISPNYVITAAHCVITQLPANLTKVILGVVDLVKEKPIEVEIESTCVHPEYRPTLYYNDIALLRLKTPIRFSSSVQPACLYSGRNFPENKKLHITGWGATNKEGTLSSKVLLKAQNEPVSLTRCNESYVETHDRRFPKGIESSQLCTRDTRGKNSSTFCDGDSGGPLQSEEMSSKNIFNIVGIISFGPRSCGGQHPFVYTRVAHFLDWIEQIVWSNGTSTGHLCKQRRTPT